MWLTGAGYDVVFDLSRTVVMALAGVAVLANETGRLAVPPRPRSDGLHRRHGEPVARRGDERRPRFPDGSPGEGGSILLLQQWEHDAIGWEALPVAAQEDIIGRRKADSDELDPQPPTSHVARTDQDDFGKIFRRNIAYGTLDAPRHDLRRASAATRRSCRRCSRAWSGSAAARSIGSRPSPAP